MRPWTLCPRSVRATLFLRARTGVVLVGVEGSCDGVDPSRSSSHSSALVPRAVCDWSASRGPLRIRAPARGPRPTRPFHHGLVVVPSEVISYLSLSICLSIWSSLFNRHLWFTFGLYVDLVRPRPNEESVQGLLRAVRRSHGCGRQVDVVLRGSYRGPRTTGPLDFVLP
jgi:hypothetical protein